MRPESRNTPPQRRPWLRRELRMLRTLYPDLAETVARGLGRSVRSVYGKAGALGLRKSAAFMASDRSQRIQRGKQLPAMLRGMT